MAVVTVTAFFWHNMVYITLILPPGGLLANKGGQGILREMHRINVAIHFQEQKT